VVKELKVKCFYGNNLLETLVKVKAEMGSDAVIVKINKRRKKGLLGFFKPPGVEVIAAVDNKKHEVPANAAYKETERAWVNMGAVLRKAVTKYDLPQSFPMPIRRFTG
jgi:flagellar biosynthesis GTPase FlhF